MKRHRRTRTPTGAPDLTPMIDVVFLLLIFFLVTSKPLNVIGTIEAATAGGGTVSEEKPPAILLAVTKSGYRLDGRTVDAHELDSLLQGLVQRSPDQQVSITCDTDSFHAQLVQALDLCTKTGLTDVSIMSRKR